MKLTLASVFLSLGLALGATAADSTAVSATTSTNGDQAPVAPGERYTNSVDMVLLKTGGFWAGKYEVTQKEYQKLMGSNPSAFGGESRPVDSVSWNDAMNFCAKLTARDLKEKLLPAGFYYTLPTEAEWNMLAADAGLDAAVTSQGGPRGGTSPVGSLAANSLGLYDTRGNVMEFCLPNSDQQPYRVLLGGSWQDRIEINLRKEFRFTCGPDERQNTFGFRCLLKGK